MIYSTTHTSNNPSRPYPYSEKRKTTFPGTTREFETFFNNTSWEKFASPACCSYKQTVKNHFGAAELR